MATVADPAALHGGTCIWCVETTLCVRWQRALGDAPQKAWDTCQAPPKSATGFERAWQAVAAWIAQILTSVFGNVVF